MFVASGQTNYTYDLNGQLTAVSSPHTSESFDYDALGNRVVDNRGSYSYDQARQLLNEDWQYRYDYDANGNLIRKTPKDDTKEAFAYTYSSKNQLIQVRVFATPLGAVTKQIDYVYDVAGRRIQKSVFDAAHQTNPTKSYTRKFVYDGDNIFLEFDGSNGVVARHTHSPLKPDDILMTEVSAAGVTQGLAQQTGGFYYLKDSIGSVTDIADSAGNVVQKYLYSSFGVLRGIKDVTGADIKENPVLRAHFTFTGREWDDESGLYYYRARYYDANIGRFLQKDSDPGKMQYPTSVVNSYVYVANTPTAITDPSGKFWWLLAFAALGAYQGYSAATSAGLSGWSMIGAIALGAVSGVAAPGAAQLWGITAGLATAAVAGAAFQAGMQTLAFGKVIFSDRVWASAGAGFVGGVVGYGAGSMGYSFGLSQFGANIVDNTISLGLGAMGGGIAIQTPSQAEVDYYRYTIRGYENGYAF